MPRRNLCIPIPIPPDAHPEVAEAHQRRDKLLDDLAAAEGEREDTKASVEPARQKDLDAAIEAAEAGRALSKTGKHEQAALAAVEAAERKVAALKIACERAALPLLHLIEQHAPAWAAAQRERRQSAEDAYTVAVDEARTAARELGAARDAEEWLTGFTAEDYLRGGPIFHGRGHLRVEHDPNLLRGDMLTVERLLQVAATVTETKPRSELQGPLHGQPRRRFAKDAA